MLTLWSNVYVIRGFGSIGFVIIVQPFPMVWLIGQTSLVGVGHSRSDSIVPLMLRTVCYAIVGALALCYRSLGTSPIMLRMSNISGKPYC
jgi:hypothetical protein